MAVESDQILKVTAGERNCEKIQKYLAFLCLHGLI